MSHLGLNSHFLTKTPDDECSFRVRLYVDPNNTVIIVYQVLNKFLQCTDSISCRQHEIPDINDFNACKADCDLRRHFRTKYPGACSLAYQQVIEILVDCLLQWDSKRNSQKKENLGTCHCIHPSS